MGTIRDEIKERYRAESKQWGHWGCLLVLGTWVGLVALISYGVSVARHRRLLGTTRSQLLVGLIAILLVGMATGLIRLRRSRLPSQYITCPKCGGPLSDFVMNIVLINNKRSPATIDHCPHCGVNFDGPMPDQAPRESVTTPERQIE